MKTSYLALTLDVLHHGHINLINKASKNCKLIVGLLTNKAIIKEKRIPVLDFKSRKKILENIKGVYKVIPQNEWDYSKNIKYLKPDFFFHGDDWNLTKDNLLKKNALKALKSYGGKLVEIEHTKNVSSTEILKQYQKYLTNFNSRISSLKNLIETKKIVRIIETHSPVSAIMAENVNLITKKGVKEFDGFWSSSLTDSAFLGKPDNEILNISERISRIRQIFDVTTKPLIMDIDTGGKIEHLKNHISMVENLGISAVIMEDKKGLKKNSLFGTDVKQEQESPRLFADKIRSINRLKKNKDFLIIARIESFILNKPIKDALNRSSIYLKNGADGIMIHDKDKSPKKILEFAKQFRKKNKSTPLVSVPSSYNSIYEKELIKAGFNIVIYANHMFRASYPAMLNVAKLILKYGRSKEADRNIMSIKKILNLIPGTK